MTRLIAGNKQKRSGQPDVAPHSTEMANFHPDPDSLRLKNDKFDEVAKLSGT
jgi:hypothetical protein